MEGRGEGGTCGNEELEGEVELKGEVEVEGKAWRKRGRERGESGVKGRELEGEEEKEGEVCRRRLEGGEGVKDRVGLRDKVEEVWGEARGAGCGGRGVSQENCLRRALMALMEPWMRCCSLTPGSARARRSSCRGRPRNRNETLPRVY